MWVKSLLSLGYLEHHYTLHLILVFRSLNDVVLLLLFIVPESLNMTSAVAACYTFTGNSGERQWQTWIAEVTCRERERESHECLLCMGVPSATNNQKPMWAQLPMIAPAVKRIFQGVLKMRKKKRKKHKPIASSLFHYTDLHVMSWNLTCHLIRKRGCAKTFADRSAFIKPRDQHHVSCAAQAKRRYQIWNSNDIWTVLENLFRPIKCERSWWNHHLKNES